MHDIWIHAHTDKPKARHPANFFKVGGTKKDDDISPQIAVVFQDSA